MKGSGADEAEETGEGRERETGAAAARETSTDARERDDSSQTEVRCCAQCTDD